MNNMSRRAQVDETASEAPNELFAKNGKQGIHAGAIPSTRYWKHRNSNK